MTVSRPLARRTLFSGLTALCLVGTAACGSSDASGSTQSAPASQAGDTRTVTDAKGVQVQVPSKPSRVVALHYAGTQAVMDLGVKPVGTGPAGQAGDDGEDYVPAHLWKDLKDIPIVNKGPEVDVEAVAKQEPDLILATNITEDDVLAQLRKIAPVYQFTLRGGERKDWQSRVGQVADALNRTPQYEQLEALQREYGPRGFTVLGFPCNQFLGQEPGSMEEILEYCSMTWGVTFPVFDKVKVNGPGAAPLYKALKKAKDAEGQFGPVLWNFEKFVLTPDGAVHRFRPTTKPDDPAVIEVIEANLPR